MRRAYLFNQPASDADHMGAEGVPFIDMPGTDRRALGDLAYRGGLTRGDVLCVTAISKLGKGQGAVRLRKHLESAGVMVEVVDLPHKAKPRGKRRAPDDDEVKHLKALWASALDPSAAIAQASRRMGFEVSRNWMNNHVCLRDGSDPVKVKRKSKEAD